MVARIRSARRSRQMIPPRPRPSSQKRGQRQRLISHRLPEPVDNPRNAFCCRVCFTSYFPVHPAAELLPLNSLSSPRTSR
jgi:hypothetical protein